MPAPTMSTGSPSRGGVRRMPWQQSRPARAGSRRGRTPRRGLDATSRRRQHLLAPFAAQALGKPERTAASDNPAVEVETRRRPSARAVRARRVDPSGCAGNARVDGDPRPHRVPALRSCFDHATGDLVAEHEGKRTAHPHQGRRRARVVGEEVGVAATDPAGGAGRTLSGVKC
jgi:hypothetical protein